MNLREIKFGIEIETVKATRQTVAEAIRTVVGGTVSGAYVYEVHDERGRGWKVLHDASLTSVPDELRAEIVSPVLEYADLETVQAVVRAVREAGATVDATCGIHVHVDAAAFDGKHLAILAKLVYKQEPILLQALGVSAARQGRFTRPVEPRLIEQIERYQPVTREALNPIWYGQRTTRFQRYDDSRYHGLNLHSVWYRGTVEFRYFESTLHAGKVKGYIQFCLAVAAQALNAKSAVSKQRPYNPASAKYDFRCWLLRLGLIGDEFKTARKHLLDRLPGDAAFKRGRRAA